MSLEILKEEIRRAAEEEKLKILEEAKRKAGEILEKAKVEAERIREEKRKSVEKELSEKRRIELALARIEGRSMLLKSRSELIEEVFNVAMEKLIRIADQKSKEYENSLINLAVEAANQLDSEEIVFEVKREDYELFRKLLPRIRRKLKGRRVRLSDRSANIMGGVIAYTPDQKHIYNNSFEARMFKFKNEYKGKLMGILFGGEGVE